MIDRRTFLQLPIVFGLGDLFLPAAQDPPAWWKDALDRMKKLDRPGLVLVMPETEEARDAYARAVLDLLESEDSRAREIFCAAVFIFLRREPAIACLGADASEGRVLALDSDGRVTGKVDRMLDDLKEAGAFHDRASKLLYGDADARLAPAAERVRAKLTPGEMAALGELTAEEPARRDAATAVLARNSDALMPLLVQERRRSKDPERAARLRRVIDGRFEAADEKTPGPRLPFGARIDPGWSCAPGEEEGVAIQCGQAKLEGKGQRFLRFLEK